MKTELEYMVITARSIFDLLQEALAEIWNEKIRLVDAAADALKKRNRLPDKFSKVVLVGDAVRTRDELIGKYAIGKVEEVNFLCGRLGHEVEDVGPGPASPMMPIRSGANFVPVVNQALKIRATTYQFA